MLRLCGLPSLTKDDLNNLNVSVQDLEVDLNCVDQRGFPPLLLLCCYNQSDKLVELVTAILSRNSVDLDYQNANGWNALISICFYCQNPHVYEVVALLLKNDVDTHAVTKKGWSAIFALCRRIHKAEPYFFDVFQLLINKIDVATKTSAGSHVLVALTYICTYIHNTHIFGGFLFNLWFRLRTHPFCVLQRSFDYFSFMVYALYQSVLCPEKIFISTFITCLHLVPIRLAS